MFHYLCIVVSCCVQLGEALRTVPLYAQDFSEHCKRRDALPSVFLGRQVMEANSQVLHFSKLDLPYSCYASIRTEASHNIIMVIQLDKSDQNFCKHGDQLVVYDFAETFGGYWGPIPEAVFERDPRAPVYTKQYTLESSPVSVKTRAVENVTEVSITSSTTTSSSSSVEMRDYIEIEVPIVNISASVAPSDTQEQRAFDIDEFFDVFYDVTPRPGKPYDTSVLPLVQIAVKKQDGRREGDVDSESKYQLDYNLEQFTPDHRLTVTVPEWPKKINRNRNRNRWKKKKLQDKRVEPKTNNSLHTREPATRKFFRKQYMLPTTSLRPSYKYWTPDVITENKYENTKDEEPFNLIDSILRSLNETGDLKVKQTSTRSDIFAMLNPFENKHNLSAYLAPYPTSTFLPVSDVHVNVTKVWSAITFSESTEKGLRLSSQEHQVDYTINDPGLEDKTNMYQSRGTSKDTDITFDRGLVKKEEVKSTKEIVTAPLAILPGEVETNANIIIGTSSEPFTNANEKVLNASQIQLVMEGSSLSGTTMETSTLSGTLVDHESWENVVQSAPVMAGLLNQHGSEPGNSSYLNSDITAAHSERRGRRKRHISAIAINAARPHRRATTRKPRVTASHFAPADVHQFARYMELPDDQMSNHVTIKLDTNSSIKLFNLCEVYDGIKTRYLLLFNSSRIILNIENFSMPHAMVVLTTGRPLALDEPLCPDRLIECQVLGTRLCIDKSNTCNGIPNCGSSNAYDEDRVLCRHIGPEPNVYLAAVTFLCVLLTAMYIANYWLKRCVPNVADAFFVYADSADNELYLDSIMRSPMDTTHDGNYIFDSNLFADEHISDCYEKRKSTSIFQRVFSILPKISFFKQCHSSSVVYETKPARQGLPGEIPKKLYSFTELQIRDIIRGAKIDREVQTGESLEMAYLKMINAFKSSSSQPKPSGPRKKRASVRDIELRDVLTGLRPHSSETCSESPGPSGGIVDTYRRSDLPVVGEEEEIHSTFYEPGVSGNIIKSESGKNGDKALGRKCLRFNDRMTYISRIEDEEEVAKKDEPTVKRRPSGVYKLPGRMGKRLHQKHDDDDTERGGADFRNFFRKKKDRK